MIALAIQSSLTHFPLLFRKLSPQQSTWRNPVWLYPRAGRLEMN
jgi:hypothetical protein